VKIEAFTSFAMNLRRVAYGRRVRGAGWVAVVVTTLVLPGCGSSHRHLEKLAVSDDGRTVIQDAYDGHLDRDWSCGSLRAAYKRLPKDGVSSTLPVVIARAVAEACDAALKSVHVRMTTASVRVALGSPDKAGRCWRFSWPPADAGQSVLDDPSKRRSAVDGARACFNDGRVSLLQTAVHG
jgi:hypothetical protein